MSQVGLGITDGDLRGMADRKKFLYWQVYEFLKYNGYFRLEFTEKRLHNLFTYKNEGITGILHEIKQYCEFNKKFPFINFIDGIQKPSSFEPQVIRNPEIIAMIKLRSSEKYKQ